MTRHARIRDRRLRRFAAGACSTCLLAALAATVSGADTTGRQQSGKRGMVVAVCPLAAEAGLHALQRGGNAVDAAVATAMTLAVTWPEAGNIGGGGFMLVRPGDGRPPQVIDYRETAPAAAAESMLADPARVRPHQTVGVPGTVAGLAVAHQQYGKLPWRELVMPAATLADQGFAVDAALADSLNKALRDEGDFVELHRVYGPPAGRDVWVAGDRLALAELGATLRAIALRGPREFYEGATADRIVAEMRSGGGLITRADLLGYRAKLREPIHGTYRGYQLLGPPPPSSGGITLVQMLNVMENFSFGSGERFSSRTLHLLAESMRRAYHDRARYLGDPDFVEIPRHLVDKDYAKLLASEIDPARATPSRLLAGELPIVDDGPHTTHFSVVDGSGMAVSNTYTLEQEFGSHLVVRGGGFLLNDEMRDFNRRPGVTDTKGQIGTLANRIAPGKRMLSSMTPLIVTSPDGELLMVTGSPGGRTIINTVACILLSTLEFKLSPSDAVQLPRMHQAWFPDRISAEDRLFADYPDSVKQLEQMGHTVYRNPDHQGDAHTIWVDPSTHALEGIADPRRRGAARGF
jgi:gamma-glutamyltranspeptidase/glutathione hydrolase